MSKQPYPFFGRIVQGSMSGRHPGRDLAAAVAHPTCTWFSHVSKEQKPALSRLQMRKFDLHEMIVGIGDAKDLTGIQSVTKGYTFGEQKLNIFSTNTL